MRTRTEKTFTTSGDFYITFSAIWAKKRKRKKEKTLCQLTKLEKLFPLRIWFLFFCYFDVTKYKIKSSGKVYL